MVRLMSSKNDQAKVPIAVPPWSKRFNSKFNFYTKHLRISRKHQVIGSQKGGKFIEAANDICMNLIFFSNLHIALFSELSLVWWFGHIIFP